MNDPAPSSKVEVGLTHQYVSFACDLNGWQTEVREWWTELGDLLGGRPGWYCELANTDRGYELMWSFGAMGTSLFNITAPTAEDDEVPADYAEKRYRLFDYEADGDVFLDGVTALREWLDANESRHADHIKSALRPMAEADNWSIFKTYVWDVEVTYSDGHWIAHVPNLPGEAAMRTELTDALADVRQFIALLFDSPESVVNELRIAPRLDWAAAAALDLPPR